MFDCVKKGLRDLFRNKLRSFLTIGGIAVGVLSVVVISSIGEMGKTTINAQMNSMGMDSVVVSGEPNSNAGLSEEDLADLKRISEIANAMPLMNIVTKSTILRTDSTCMLWGVNEDAGQVIELVPVHGRLLNRVDVLSGAKVCIIDEQLALQSYKRSNIVGKTVSVNVGGQAEDFTVVGVVKNGVNLLQNMLGEIIPGFVYIPYTTMQEESSRYFFDQICVKLMPESQSEEISRKIKTVIMANKGFETEIQIDNLLKQKTQLGNIMNVITVVLSLIAGISLVVSGLSIMTVMLVSINERTREIGIKKSIGATNFDIMTEFLLEAVLITLMGGIAGSAAGVGISALGCLMFGAEIYINLPMIFGIIGFSLLIGLVFGVYPAYKAARLKPVDALRME